MSEKPYIGQIADQVRNEEDEWRGGRQRKEWAEEHPTARTVDRSGGDRRDVWPANDAERDTLFRALPVSDSEKVKDRSDRLGTFALTALDFYVEKVSNR